MSTVSAIDQQAGSLRSELLSEGPRVLGTHLLLELYDCNIAALNQADEIEEKLVAAAKQAGATVVTSTFHQFSPQGVSGVVVIAESHITIHTWPELGYAALDVFTCGSPSLPGKISQILIKAFQARSFLEKSIDRGISLPLESRKSDPQL